MRPVIAPLAVAALLAAPTAARADVATIALTGKASASLRSQGVRMVAVPPAELVGRALALTSRPGTGSARTYAGGLLLRGRRGRVLVLTALRAPATGAGRVTALVAGRRLVIGRSGRAAAGATAAVTVDASFARVLRRRLALRRLPRGTLGTLRRVATGAPRRPPRPRGRRARPRPARRPRGRRAPRGARRAARAAARRRLRRGRPAPAR